MPEPDLIVSTANRRVVEARKLRQRKHRRESGRFLLEGIQALHMALDAGVTPLEVFYTPAHLSTPGAAALLDRLRATPALLLPVIPAVMEAMSERDEPQGVIAVFPLTPRDLASLTIGGPHPSNALRSTQDAALVLVLDRPQDPGNTGTLIRTADAAGAAAAILIEPCVDPYDPKALRSSMGSIFNLPVVTVRAVEELFAWLASQRLRPVAADAHAGELWGDESWQGRVALALGNEARGLSPDVAARIAHHVRLPMAGRADSLNVSVAGGIMMYLWVRQNRG
jgi:RNA methyltransferase, TrmH family